MKNKKLEVITCPSCKKEYLPSEIYVPSGFFCTPSAILRNEDGGIESIVGDSLDVSEEFTCTKCNSKFAVLAKISFTTSLIDDFEEESTTVIQQNLLFNED